MSTTPTVKSAQAIFDEQIEKCEARIAQYTGKIAALANNPDAGPAREMMAKVLESERNFKASLEDKRATSAKARRARSFGTPVTWRWLVFMGVVFAASLLFSHARHH